MTSEGPSKEMSVAQVLARWPETTAVFLALRTACPGCALSRFCSLADVAREYALPVEDLLDRLQQVLEVRVEEAEGSESEASDSEASERGSSIDDPFERPRRSLRAAAAILLLAGLLQACGDPSDLSGGSTVNDAGAAVSAASGQDTSSVSEAIDEGPDPEPASTPAGLRGEPILPERPAPDFALQGAGGADWRLSEARGRVVALFFGYTHCPDVCPQTLNRVRQALLQLDDDQAAEVLSVLITVDPERDTAERLERYVTGFGAGFVGLRGSPEAIADVAVGYGVRYEKELPDGADPQAAAENYTVAHSGRVFLIDAAGQLRTSFIGPFLPEEMAQDLRLLLSERRP